MAFEQRSVFKQRGVEQDVLKFAEEHGCTYLDIRFMGSVDAIAALNAGRCMMAGFHTTEQPHAQSVAARTYRSLLKPGLHKLIGFAQRTQGLMVAKGNLLQVTSL